MKHKTVILGIGVILIILLSSFSSIANAQSIKSVDTFPSLIHQVTLNKKSLDSDINLELLIGFLINLLFSIFIWWGIRIN